MRAVGLLAARSTEVVVLHPRRRGSYWGTDIPLGLGVARGGVEPPTFRFSVGRSYQLSYLAEQPALRAGLATPTGLEPATSAVTGRRANQLRYGALVKAVSPTGFEPALPP